MKMRIARRALFVAVLSMLAVVFAAAPALALGTVPNHAIVGGRDLYGLTEAKARAVISEAASVTALPKLTVTLKGSTYLLGPKRYMVLNVDKMIERAYEPTSATSFVLGRSVSASSAAVAKFVKSLEPTVYRKPKSAAYYVSGERLKVAKSNPGRRLARVAANKSIKAALVLEGKTGVAQPPVALKCVAIAPKVTGKNLGRAILVDLSKRRLWVYENRFTLKTWRTAIGQPSFPTPTGAFKIIRKSSAPSWTNPGSDWAANMPAYIPPGPSNPLGVRALYLNTPGIRIHGTNKLSSIGTAASHGCVRMRNSDIKKLYPMVKVNTRVFIIK